VRKVLVGGFAVVIGIACFASPAWAGRPTFDSSPTSGPAGTVIHANGTQCSDVAGQGVTVVLGQDDEATIATVNGTTVAGGNWSVDLTVPLGTKTGAYEVHAYCSADEDEFTYNTNDFTVTAAPATTTTTSTTTTVAAQAVTTTTTVPPVAPAAAPVVAQPTMTG